MRLKLPLLSLAFLLLFLKLSAQEPFTEPHALNGTWQLYQTEINGKKTLLDQKLFNETYVFHNDRSYSRTVVYEDANTSEKGQWSVGDSQKLRLFERHSELHHYSKLHEVNMRIESINANELVVSVPEGNVRTLYFYRRLP